MAESQVPKVPTDEQQLERERSEIREAVADAWQTWAQFEDTLAMLLEQAVQSRLHTLGLAIYYVPNNTETRINIVDVCVRRYLRDYQIDQPLLPSWETIIAQTNKAKNTRNRIIHGSLIIHVSKRGKQSFRLSGQLFDLERSAHPTNQLPGMSAHDITHNDLSRKTALVAVSMRDDVEHHLFGERRLRREYIARHISSIINLSPEYSRSS
jgi:hypothetical protein